MKPRTLDQLQAVWAAIPEPDRDAALGASLAADLAAARRGAYLVVLAPDEASASRVADIARRAAGEVPIEVLPPYRQVAAWSAAEQAQLDLALAVLAVTSARQLLPRSLGDALQVAAGNAAPMAVLVLDLGRIGDPQQLARRLPFELTRALGGRPPRRVFALGEPPRFAGPDLEEAATAATQLLLERRPAQTTQRLRLLCDRRRRQLAAGCRGRADQLRSRLDPLTGAGDAVAGGRGALETVCRSQIAGWNEHLKLLTDALKGLSISALVEQANTQAPAAQGSQLLDAILQREAAARLPDAAEAAHERLRQAGEQLIADAAAQRARYLAAFGSLLPSPPPASGTDALQVAARELQAAASEILGRVRADLEGRLKVELTPAARLLTGAAVFGVPGTPLGGSWGTRGGWSTGATFSSLPFSPFSSPYAGTPGAPLAGALLLQPTALRPAPLSVSGGLTPVGAPAGGAPALSAVSRWGVPFFGGGRVQGVVDQIDNFLLRRPTAAQFSAAIDRAAGDSERQWGHLCEPWQKLAGRIAADALGDLEEGLRLAARDFNRRVKILEEVALECA